LGLDERRGEKSNPTGKSVRKLVNEEKSISKEKKGGDSIEWTRCYNPLLYVRKEAFPLGQGLSGGGGREFEFQEQVWWTLEKFPGRENEIF